LRRRRRERRGECFDVDEKAVVGCEGRVSERKLAAAGGSEATRTSFKERSRR
jgi:hypothetical protein